MGAKVNIIRGIAADEVQRQKELLERVERKIRVLPAGSIQIKPRRRRSYAYLSFRKEGRSVSEYIGAEGSPRVLELKNKIEERRRLEEQARQHRQEIRDLQKEFNV